MIQLDPDALACDLAQYYHIIDMERLPLEKVAVFACGLPEESRIMLKLQGQPVNSQIVLLASIYDTVNMLWWAKTEDGAKNRNRPQSLTQMIMGEDQKSQSRGFTSGEEFKRARAELIKKMGGD